MVPSLPSIVKIDVVIVERLQFLIEGHKAIVSVVIKQIIPVGSPR